MQESLDKKKTELNLSISVWFLHSLFNINKFSVETVQKSKLSWLSRSYGRPKLHIQFGVPWVISS